MTQELLHRPDVVPRQEEVRGERMAERLITLLINRGSPESFTATTLSLITT